MVVKNIRYLAYDIDKWLEQNFWYVTSVYSSRNRRFELFCGMFGRKCDIPVYILIEHAMDTWRNSRLTLRIVLVGQDKNTEYELCLYEKEFGIGDCIENSVLESMLKLLSIIRDNPCNMERTTKTKDISVLLEKCVK